MADIILRSDRVNGLSNDEIDLNFTNLNHPKVTAEELSANPVGTEERGMSVADVAAISSSSDASIAMAIALGG